MPSFPAAGSPAGQLSVRHGPHPSTGRSSRTSGPAWSRPHKPATPVSVTPGVAGLRQLGVAWSLLGAASGAANHHDRAVAAGDAVLADRAEEHARELTVATPVWFVVDGERLLVHTGSATGKVKRIRNNPQVTVAACTARGVAKGPVLQATASILPDSAGDPADRLFAARYPVAWRLITGLFPLIRLVRRRPATPEVFLEITLH